VDQYVVGVTEAFQKHLRQSAVESGRQLIDRQQCAEARMLFLRVLRKKYLWRPALLFIFSYSPQPVFKGGLKIKRTLVQMKVFNEEMEFRLLKKLTAAPEK
jgi:hypothetical protein